MKTDRINTWYSYLLALISIYSLCLPEQAKAQLVNPKSTTSTAVPTITTCRGEYALCASSTGTLTGRNITVTTSTETNQIFPETLVVCPILRGTSIGYLNVGTMGNSCKAPSGSVYSLYSTQYIYPQEAKQFQIGATKLQICLPQDTTINTTTWSNQATQALSQCWNMKCSINAKKINGAKTANCLCAMGESPTGGLIPASLNSVTGAGMGNSAACSQYPVAGAQNN